MGGAFSSFLARVVGSVMGAGVVVAMTRSLSVTDFGVYSLGLTLVQMGNRVSESGVSSILTREAIAHPEREVSLLRWSAALRFVTGLVVCVAFLGVAWALVDNSQDLAAIAFLLLTLPLLGFVSGMDAIGRRFRLNLVALLLIFQSALWLSAVLMLAVMRSSLLWYTAAYLISTCIFGLVVVFATSRIVSDTGIRLRRAEAWRHFRQAIPLGLSGMIILAYGKVDSILLYAIKGAEANAPYALAYRLLDQFSILPVSIAAVFIPLINYQFAAGKALNPVVQRWVRLSLVSSTPIVLAAVLYADEFVPLVFGERYLSSVTLVRLLAPAFLIICLGWPPMVTAIAIGKVRGQLAVTSLGLVVNVAGNIVLIPRIGAVGACLMTILTEFLVVALMFWMIAPTARLGFPPVGLYVRIGLLTVGVASGVYWLPAALGVLLVGAGWTLGAIKLGLVSKADLYVHIPARKTGDDGDERGGRLETPQPV